MLTCNKGSNTILLDLFTSLNDFSDTLYLRVSVKAAKNAIKVEHRDDGTKLIRVHVTARAENNKANQAVLKLLAKELGIKTSCLTITHGHKSRDKIISIKTQPLAKKP